MSRRWNELDEAIANFGSSKVKLREFFNVYLIDEGEELTPHCLTVSKDGVVTWHGENETNTDDLYMIEYDQGFPSDTSNGFNTIAAIIEHQLPVRFNEEITDVRDLQKYEVYLPMVTYEVPDYDYMHNYVKALMKAYADEVSSNMRYSVNNLLVTSGFKPIYDLDKLKPSDIKAMLSAKH